MYAIVCMQKSENNMQAWVISLIVWVQGWNLGDQAWQAAVTLTSPLFSTPASPQTLPHQPNQAISITQHLSNDRLFQRHFFCTHTATLFYPWMGWIFDYSAYDHRPLFTYIEFNSPLNSLQNSSLLVGAHQRTLGELGALIFKIYPNLLRCRQSAANTGMGSGQGKSELWVAWVRSLNF